MMNQTIHSLIWAASLLMFGIALVITLLSDRWVVPIFGFLPTIGMMRAWNASWTILSAAGLCYWSSRK